MLNDDLNRNDLNRDNMRLNQDPLTPNDRYEGMSSGWMMLIAAVAVMAVLFMWAPWSGPRVADNTAPGTTTGSSTRPNSSGSSGRPGADHSGCTYDNPIRKQPLDAKWLLAAFLLLFSFCYLLL